MKRYNPTDIEPKWQAVWEKEGTYKADLDDTSKKKYYAFSMLPGITGAGIHIGHGRTYQFSDIKVRAKRQQGYNAYHPIGWDSFGLPVENYAIKIGESPRVAHDTALINFKSQLKRLGFSFDWSKEISTADPDYYKWTQWIFTQLYKNGLAYQKEQPQWWCETDNTVLANEQVEGGKCWRCNNLVVKRRLKQWFFKITEYADEMLDAIDELDWTPMVKTMQRNWIGRSQGAEVKFEVEGYEDIVKVFTTRPDTLFGSTFLVLSPEHEIIDKITASQSKEMVDSYRKEAARKSDVERMNEHLEKTGVFTGAYSTNPATGEKMPIWIADYVMAGYGTGAVMAVPGHDERDFEFASKYDLPVVKVIDKPEASAQEGAYTGEGEMINSGHFDGRPSSEVRESIFEWLEENGIGESKTTYKMHDWLISRQRYWGAPIPMVFVDGYDPIPVADSCLPVVLPEVDDFKPTGGDTTVLASIDDWVRVWVNVKTGETVGIVEPKPEGDDWQEGRRETDTLDGYACSSWYFIRYLDPHNNEEAWSKDALSHWAPVDFYNGADHAVAHLLYSRFWMRFFYKIGLVPTPEPFKRMMYNAYIIAQDGEKMSKSKGNVIDPVEIMDSGYGADSLRLYEMFIAPYDQDAPWDPRGVPGMYRFLNRVWNLVGEYLDSEDTEVEDDVAKDILRVSHGVVKKVTEDIEGDKFNTAISSMMEAVNTLYKIKDTSGMSRGEAWRYSLESLLTVLAPFAPHLSEELWSQMGHKSTIHVDNWPSWDEKLLVKDVLSIAVQVNGKLRGQIEVEASASEADVKAAALSSKRVVGYLLNKEPTRVIYIPGRLVNIVV